MSERLSTEGIPAGGFSDWLDATFKGLREGTGVVVPCGDCRACCTSAYFIHVESDETAARAAVGDDAIPAPGRSFGQKGDRVMGFDDAGVCPKMKTTGCSIYEDRPRTCRIYDCRLFAAAGLDAGPEKQRINERISAWRFEYRDEADRNRHEAVKATAVFICEHAALFPGGRIPSDPGQLALLALKTHDVMLEATRMDSPRALVARIVERARADLNRPSS